MARIGYLFGALVIVLSLGIGIHPFAADLFPSIPKAHAASVSISLSGCAFIVGACTSVGWNGTTARPNPTMTVQQGDSVSVKLSSADGASHLFLIDVDRDGGGDSADCPTVDPCSMLFSPTTPTTYTFTVSFAPGTYTYFCTIHPFSMFGSFVVVSNTVGGTTLPVDKLGILAPYIGIAGIIGLIGAMLLYLKRSARKTQLRLENPSD